MDILSLNITHINAYIYIIYILITTYYLLIALHIYLTSRQDIKENDENIDIT